MADLKKRRTSLVRDLLGHDPPPQKLVLRGMADLEKTLAQRFRELNEQRARLARANAPLWDNLRRLLGKDSAWAATVRRQRRASRKSLPSRRFSIPKPLQQKESVFLGSLGGTRVWPFDYEWTWKAPAPQSVFFSSPPVNVCPSLASGPTLSCASTGGITVRSRRLIPTVSLDFSPRATIGQDISPALWSTR